MCAVCTACSIWFAIQFFGATRKCLPNSWVYIVRQQQQQREQQPEQQQLRRWSACEWQFSIKWNTKTNGAVWCDFDRSVSLHIFRLVFHYYFSSFYFRFFFHHYIYMMYDHYLIIYMYGFIFISINFLFIISISFILFLSSFRCIFFLVSSSSF